jgi:hypothetical protein
MPENGKTGNFCFAQNRKYLRGRKAEVFAWH